MGVAGCDRRREGEVRRPISSSHRHLPKCGEFGDPKDQKESDDVALENENLAIDEQQAPMIESVLVNVTALQ